MICGCTLRLTREREPLKGSERAILPGGSPRCFVSRRMRTPLLPQSSIYKAGTLLLDSGVYAPALSEKHNSFRSYWISGLRLQCCLRSTISLLGPLQKKGCKEERVTSMRLHNRSTSTTLASNKSLSHFLGCVYRDSAGIDLFVASDNKPRTAPQDRL